MPDRMTVLLVAAVLAVIFVIYAVQAMLQFQCDTYCMDAGLLPSDIVRPCTCYRIICERMGTSNATCKAESVVVE